MASGATVKLGVEGISQFKQNMTQAKQAVKTLDAQLALTEKQFKASGDAESYMTEKTELLKAKLEQQKAVVDNAQKALDDMASRGVDRASKAYQDMYRQMINAKGALIDTENQLNGVADAGDAASDNVSEMNAQLKRVGDGVNFQQVTSGIGSITDGLEKAAKKALNLGKQIINTMVSAGSWADDLHTRATYYGLSDEELQRMEKTATLIDTPVEAIITARKKLAKEKEAAGKNDMGAWAVLGIDPRDTKDPEDLLWKTGEALMKLTDESKQEAYAQELLGRSWSELIPLFTAGRKEYEKTNASWKVVSQESIDALGKMDDEYQRLMADWEAFKYEALAQFAEPMSQAFQAAQGALGKFMEYLKSEEGQKLIDNVMNSLKKAIEWISEPQNIQKAIDAMKTLIIGWGALLAGREALQILNFINGAKGLFGGGKGGNGGAEGTAAAAGGGWWTGVANGLTGAAATSSAYLTASGIANWVPMIGDWFMNQTNAGRGLRDGGGFAGLWEGLKQDVSEKGEEIKQNIETIEDDWKNNAIVKFFTDRDANQDAASRLATGADWRPSYMGGGSPVLTPDNYDRGYGTVYEFDQMQQATEDLIGASDAQRKSSTEMTEAAGTMKGLPGVIEGAIITGASKIKIYIDGQQAGGILTPYVNNAMAGVITALVK